MDKKLAERVLIEEQRRRKIADLVDVAGFPQQQKFIRDPSRRKAALCTRRAGKTFAVGLYLFQEALTHKDISCLYVGLVRKAVKATLWTKVLKRLNRDYSIGAKFNDTELTVQLPNGSIIYLLGLDSTFDQQERVRGDNHHLVVVDEAGSFKNDLRNFVKTTLLPLTIDTGGTVCLIGTPRDSKNFFYDVTTGKESGWSVHRWTGHDNVSKDAHGKTLASKFAQEIENIRIDDPKWLAAPKFRQEYYGEWCIDDNALVYRYNDDLNFVPSLPDAPTYHHVVGLDLGFNDDAAWVVVAYSDHDPNLYVREVKSEAKLITSQIAEYTQYLVDLYAPHAVVVDTGGGGKTTAEEMKQRYGLPIEAAEKQDKPNAIWMLNSDMIGGRIRLLPGCERLSSQWNELVWDEGALKLGRRLIAPGVDDHLSDAFLYAWRRCKNFAAQTRLKRAAPGSLEEEDEYLAEAAMRRRNDRSPWTDLPNYLGSEDEPWHW